MQEGVGLGFYQTHTYSYMYFIITNISNLHIVKDKDHDQKAGIATLRVLMNKLNSQRRCYTHEETH